MKQADLIELVKSNSVRVVDIREAKHAGFYPVELKFKGANDAELLVPVEQLPMGELCSQYEKGTFYAKGKVVFLCDTGYCSSILAGGLKYIRADIDIDYLEEGIEGWV